MKLDLLVFGAHPDDAELGAGGTIAKEVARGKKVGIIDLTRGELGTRGTPEIRDKEARRAGEILGLAVRASLVGGRDSGARDFTNRSDLALFAVRVLYAIHLADKVLSISCSFRRQVKFAKV